MADGPLIAAQYRLVEEIGRGGFGVVWHAHDERLHRDVAAKQLFLPHYLSVDQRRERHVRSLREARSAARIHHPNAVTVHDVVIHDDCPWIIMEYVPGRSLDSIVKTREPLAPPRVAEIGLAVAQALRAAHAAGVIHRDVKPANVLIGAQRIVLTDFGIAQIEGDVSLTETGLVMGAPAYTSPERARGDTAIAASDLWSLGATLFYAVEGRRPFPGANANAVFHAVITEDPVATRRAGPLTSVINGLLRKDPEERLSADEVIARLAALAGDGSPSADRDPTQPDVRLDPPMRVPRPGRRILLGAAVVATVIFSMTALWMRVSADAGRAHQPAVHPPAVHQMRDAVPPSSADPSHAANAAIVGTLTGNGADVRALAFSPDGRTLAIGADDDQVRLWDTRSHSVTATLTAHHYQVLAAAFNASGTMLATGSYDGQVLLWNTESHQHVTLNPSGNSVNSLSFTPDGTSLVVASGDAVQVWGVKDRTPEMSLTGTAGDTVFTAAVSRSGTVAVAGTRTLRLFSSGSDRESTLGQITSAFNSMAFSPKGRVLACAGADGAIHLWDTVARRRLGSLTGTGRSVTAVSFSSDGMILAGADGSSVTLWNATTQRRITTLASQQQTPIETIAFSPDGSLLATAGSTGSVTLWSIPR